MKRVKKSLKFARQTMTYVVVFFTLGLLCAQTKEYIHEPLLYNYIDSNVFEITGNNSIGTSYQIIFNSKKYMVTNSHICLTHINNYMVVFVDGLSVPLKVLRQDLKHDICILEPVKTVSGLRLQNFEWYRFENVYSIGFPFAAIRVPMRGKIFGSSLIDIVKWVITDQATYEDCNYIHGTPAMDFNSGRINCMGNMDVVDTTMVGGPGASGSPMVNSFGLVVGTTAVYASPSLNLSFVPNKHLIELIKTYESSLK